MMMLVLFSGTIIIQITYLKLFCSILAGLLLSRMFVIYHDYQHEAILRGSKIARLLMTFFGIFALAPPRIWKYSHDHHHDNNSRFSHFVTGNFPQITKNRYLLLTNKERLKYLILRHSLIILLSYPIVFLTSFCLIPFLESPKKYWDSLLAFIIHILLFFFYYRFGGWALVILSQIIPFYDHEYFRRVHFFTHNIISRKPN